MSEGLIQLVAGAPMLLLAFGAALTLLCQSSTVAGAIAVAAANSEVIDFSGACWLVYGANVGSAANHYLLAAGMRGEARQIALMQVVQKLGGFAGVLVILSIGEIIDRPIVEMAVASVAVTAGGKVAWVFLVYQAIGSLACSIAFEPLVAALERMAPPSKLQELSKPAFLIDEALVEPSFALDLAGREERRLLERLPAMLDGLRADGGTPEASPEVLQAAGKNVSHAMAAYLQSVLAANVERGDRERVVRLQHRTANLPLTVPHAMLQ